MSRTRSRSSCGSASSAPAASGSATSPVTTRRRSRVTSSPRNAGRTLPCMRAHRASSASSARTTPDCTIEQLAITNRAGPLATLSFSNTSSVLTTPVPGGEPGRLARLYPTGVRHYARVVGADDGQGIALAQFAHDRGAARIEIVYDDDDYGRAVAWPARRAARRLGMRVDRAAPDRSGRRRGARPRARAPDRARAARCAALCRRPVLGTAAGGAARLRARCARCAGGSAPACRSSALTPGPTGPGCSTGWVVTRATSTSRTRASRWSGSAQRAAGSWRSSGRRSRAAS